jgi:tight adherence protein C
VSVLIWLSALAVVSSVPVLLWAVGGGDGVSTAAVRRNLGVGAPDVRRARLARPLPERVLLPLLDRVARHAGSALPAGQLEAAERLLALAGLTGRWSAEQLIGAKFVLGGTVAVGAAIRMAAQPSLTWLALAGLLTFTAFVTPDVVLRRLATGRQRQLERDLPDVLDQLTIAVEAGLGFEAALQRVVTSTPGPLSEEFGRMLQDVQVGTRRAVALESVVERTDAPDLRHVVMSLIQSERLGVPLAATLRSQSKEMRLKRRMSAEESANKVAVKLLFPVVFCLFPALFVVILGPAAMRIADSF